MPVLMQCAEITIAIAATIETVTIADTMIIALEIALEIADMNVAPQWAMLLLPTTLQPGATTITNGHTSKSFYHIVYRITGRNERLGVVC